jgi:putative ABC transport system substrate-binding protein
MMRMRLICITLMSILLAGWAVESRAAGKVIAAMMSSDQPRYYEAHRAFVNSLNARGYSLATKDIILQAPNPDPISWSNTIRKFNAYKPDLIVVYGASAAMVALKESDGIPVVSADIYSAEQPVRGMCGTSSRVPMITLVKALQDIRPFRRIGIICNSREIGSQRQSEDIKKAAQQLGMGVAESNTSTETAFEKGVKSLLDRSDVIIVTESGLASRNFKRIIAAAKARNIPVASLMPDSAEQGALVSLEISPEEQGHLAAEIAVRVLEGANPEHLSLLKPRRIELVINMKVAGELGLNIPFTLLGGATRVIK